MRTPQHGYECDFVMQRKCSMGYWEEASLQQVHIDKVRDSLAMPNDNRN